MKTIKNMPEHSRPREKLREIGASARAGVGGGEPAAGGDVREEDSGEAGGDLGSGVVWSKMVALVV